jgi:hypothetical protein
LLASQACPWQSAFGENRVIIRRRTLAAVATSILISGPAPASEFTGNKLQAHCADQSDTGRLICVFFLQGLVAGIEAGDGSKQKDPRIWCFPEGATLKQGRLVVEKYMRENPQMLHQDAAVVAVSALMLAFPCRTSN